MRKTILLLALGCATSYASATCKTSEPWTGKDKAQHFAAGIAIGASVSAVSGSPLWGFAAGVALGAAKEVYDSHHSLHHTCSLQDFAVTAAGAAAGALAVSWYIVPHAKGASVVVHKAF